MRRIILALALTFSVLCAPAFAQTPSICTLDGTSANTIGQCPLADTNNGLLSQGIGGAKLLTTTTLSGTPIFAHDICKYVDARGTTADLLVPFNSQAEWQAFLNNAPNGVHTAECCRPRPMVRDDVPVPTETCSTGWEFIGLVDPSDADKLLATVGPNATFVLSSGITENTNYPITKLPIERGDVGRLLPSQAQTAYVGKYHCAGEVDFSTSESPVNTTNTTTTSSYSNSYAGIIDANGNRVITTQSSTGSTNTTVGNTTGGKATNVTKLMGFAMQCVNTQWRYTSPSCFGRTTGIETQACPNGQSGLITNAIIQQCDGTITRQEVTNTCQQTCPAREITTETRTCPSGQTGAITVEIAKLCSSTQPVDATTQVEGCFCTTSETIKTNTCTNDCPPSTDMGDQTQQCPDGQTGRIVINTKKICTSQNGQCVCHDETTVKENTCSSQCPAPTDRTETRSCPNGQTGAITVKITTTCQASCQCGTSQCVCHDSEEVICNTCVNQCVPSTVTTPGVCPAGYSGTYSTTVQHLCPDNRDVTTVNNNCSLIVVTPPDETIIIIPIIIPDFDFGWGDFGGFDDFDCDCFVDGFDPEFDGGGDWGLDW
jgi:hypothetical protein